MSACGTDADCNFPNGICNEGTCHCGDLFWSSVHPDSGGGDGISPARRKYCSCNPCRLPRRNFWAHHKACMLDSRRKRRIPWRAGHYGGGGDHHARAAARRARFEKERAKYRKLRGGKKSKSGMKCQGFKWGRVEFGITSILFFLKFNLCLHDFPSAESRPYFAHCL